MSNKITPEFDLVEPVRKAEDSMKRAQLIGLGVAGTCALGVFFLMKGITNKPLPQAKVEVRAETVDVLVAKADLGLGHITTETSFRWQAWPKEAVPVGALTSAGSATLFRDLAGSIARAPILAGEPITKSKLVKPGEGGVLASILPAGKRAISTKISEDSAVGHLILPNDHVDVLLIKREKGRGGKDEHVREPLLRNVRVLAIGQRIETKDGQKVADGKTATFEVTPAQADKIALAKHQGELSLMLRSIADVKIDESELDGKRGKESDGVRMTRFGIRKSN